MVRGLRPVVAGRVLRGLEVLDPKLLERSGIEEVRALVEGRVIESVERRGKWVLLVMEPGAGVIVIQPRMTGGFWLVSPEREDHTRLIFHVEGSTKRVWYCDTRRLGKVDWYADLAETEKACGRSQGTDALVIGRDELAERLKRTSRGIKPAIMDQKVLAGLGNIYADEVLWRAGLHPSRPADRLTTAEITRLHAGIRPRAGGSDRGRGVELRRGLSHGAGAGGRLPGGECGAPAGGRGLFAVWAAYCEGVHAGTDRSADLFLPGVPAGGEAVKRGRAEDDS